KSHTNRNSSQKEISSQEKKGNQSRRERRKEGACSLDISPRHAGRSAQNPLCTQRQKWREPMGAGRGKESHWSRDRWQRILLSDGRIEGLWTDYRYQYRRQDRAYGSRSRPRLRTKFRG